MLFLACVWQKREHIPKMPWNLAGHKADGKYEVHPHNRDGQKSIHQQCSPSALVSAAIKVKSIMSGTHKRKRKEILKSSIASGRAYPFKSHLHPFPSCVFVEADLFALHQPCSLTHYKQADDSTHIRHSLGKTQGDDISRTMVGPMWILHFPSILEQYTEIPNTVGCCYTTLGCGIFSCMIREAQISLLWLGAAQCGKHLDSSVFLSAEGLSVWEEHQLWGSKPWCFLGYVALSTEL